MAEYLIQDTTLDAIAGAINAKTGGSSAMTPAEMVTAIGSISGGGGDNPVAVSLGVLLKATNAELNLDDPHITKINSGAKNYFKSCTNITSIYAPYLGWHNADNQFSSLTNLVTVRMPAIVSLESVGAFQSCTRLSIADIGAPTRIRGNTFSGASSLSKLILRKKTAIVNLDAATAFSNSSLSSGGSGCTIYIPKALYDHLGDGTSLDYKAATNWSAIEGYGTITWAQLEGSIYENPYGDWTEETT